MQFTKFWKGRDEFFFSRTALALSKPFGEATASSDTRKWNAGRLSAPGIRVGVTNHDAPIGTSPRRGRQHLAHHARKRLAALTLPHTVWTHAKTINTRPSALGGAMQHFMAACQLTPAQAPQGNSALIRHNDDR